jgi:Tfp pilus assembly protein PilE
VPRPPRTRRREGLTLVEATLLLSLAGVVLAVSVPTFVRSLRTDKMAEAPREMERIFRAAEAYYASPQPTADGKRLHCMPEAVGPTPPKPSLEPQVVAFGTGDAAVTWRAIGYEPAEPIRYRYSFLPVHTGCGVLPVDSRGEPVLVLRAEGDLDGDGVLSLYERTVVTREGQLVLEPLLSVRDRIE